MIDVLFSGNIIIGTPGRLDDIFCHKPDGLDLAACAKSLVGYSCICDPNIMEMHKLYSICFNFEGSVGFR